MTTRPRAGAVEDSVEPLLEELLTEVVTGIRPGSTGHEEKGATAALTDAAMVSFSRAVTQASAVHRALLVDALSPALAEALVPALAKELAPEIVTVLSHLAAVAERVDEELEPADDVEVVHDAATLGQQVETAGESGAAGGVAVRPVEEPALAGTRAHPGSEPDDGDARMGLHRSGTTAG